MSAMSIRAYLPFCRVRFLRQSVANDVSIAWIEAVPDGRFHPVCHACGTPANGIHSSNQRPLRDLNLGATKVWINCKYRKIYCPKCEGMRVEDLEFFEPYQRVTMRLACCIYSLCKVLTISDVARRFGLDWKIVKRIDKSFLESQFGQTDYADLRILAVDEIAIRKGHQYMTVALNYETGRVLWLGKGRKAETLMEFFDGMNAQQKKKLEAIAMDMWKPFIMAVMKRVPHVKIVFDLFHVVHSFNRVIDKVRIAECRKADKSGKAVFRGTKYLLLAGTKNIRRREARARLRDLAKLNDTVSTMMILKELLKQIWKYRRRGWARRRLREWCLMARTVPHKIVHRFAGMLERQAYGILNHCEYPIHTSKIEGVNNTIKVIKRKAYGFNDQRYFSLKVIQAFSSN